MHYFSRKKAAVSSLEWQFPHDDYKPRERPAAACTSHGSGLSALTGSGVGLHVAASGHRPTVGPNTKNPPKMRFEIDGSYWCLQRFDRFWICSANYYRKRKSLEFAETCIKKLVKSLFSADFSLLEPPCIAQCLDCLKLVKAVQLMVGQLTLCVQQGETKIFFSSFCDLLYIKFSDKTNFETVRLCRRVWKACLCFYSHHLGAFLDGKILTFCLHNIHYIEVKILMFKVFCVILKIWRKVNFSIDFLFKWHS